MLIASGVGFFVLKAVFDAFGDGSRTAQLKQAYMAGDTQQEAENNVRKALGTTKTRWSAAGQGAGCLGGLSLFVGVAWQMIVWIF